MIDAVTADYVVSGDKVTLRPFAASDITARYVGWLNDAHLMRFSNQRFVHHDERSCRAYLDSFAGTPNLFAAIVDRAGSRVIGTMTVYAAPRHGVADVGIMLGERTAHGKGFARDAWCTMIDWLLETRRTRKVTAGTLACNRPMIALMGAAGMEREAVRRAQEIVDGQPVDMHHFARFPR